MTEGTTYIPSGCYIKFLFFKLFELHSLQRCKTCLNETLQTFSKLGNYFGNCVSPNKSSSSILNHLLQKVSIQMLKMVFAKLANNLSELMQIVRICNPCINYIYNFSLHFMMHLNRKVRS